MLSAYLTQLHRAWPAWAVLALVGSAGCAGLTPDGMHLWGAKNKDLPLDPASCVIVEIRPESGEPKLAPLAYDDAMVVQTALEKSGATKRFRRMNVTLVRSRSDGKGPHKMDVTYEHGKRRVSPPTDYGLRPGDRIVAIEDNTTAVDDAIDSLTGPLKSFGRRR